MAARLERERVNIRKTRLIKQNEEYRQELQDEVENLRGAADWVERGFNFYKVAQRFGKLTSPLSFFRFYKKRSSLGTLFRGCAIGFRIWRNLRGI